MYIHLGADVVVPTKDIVGIFDLDTSSVSKTTRNYLAKVEKEGQVINVTSDIPKSFIVTKAGEKTRVYLSQISPKTLKQRASFINTISNI